MIDIHDCFKRKKMLFVLAIPVNGSRSIGTKLEIINENQIQFHLIRFHRFGHSVVVMFKVSLLITFLVTNRLHSLDH